ncbi:MAG: hypothetical protein AAF726_12095 [Planctomycetota bacterium]
MRLAGLLVLVCAAASGACAKSAPRTHVQTSRSLPGFSRDMIALAEALQCLGLADRAARQTAQLRLEMSTAESHEARTHFSPLGIKLDLPSGDSRFAARLIAHELCHAVLGRPDAEGRPIWIDEGICEFVSFRSAVGLRQLASMFAALATEEPVEARLLDESGQVLEALTLPDRRFHYPSSLGSRVEARLADFGRSSLRVTESYEPVDYVIFLLAAIASFEARSEGRQAWWRRPDDLLFISEGVQASDGLPSISIDSEIQLERCASCAAAFWMLTAPWRSGCRVEVRIADGVVAVPGPTENSIFDAQLMVQSIGHLRGTAGDD